MPLEEEGTQRKTVHEIGASLAALSVDELKNRIVALKAEIARTEAELAAKDTTRTAAEALFSRR